MIQIEIYTTFTDEYSNLFTNAFDFEVLVKKPGWIHLTHAGVADLMFFDSSKAIDGESHWRMMPNEVLGKGIEVVLLTNDIVQARKAIESYGYSCSPDRRPPWGSVEFFFRLHEGYLIRVKQRQLSER